MSKSFSARKLDVKVVLLAAAEARDGAGQPIKTWAEVARPWANVAWPYGLETIRAGAEVSIRRASVRIRRRAGVSEGMRVRLVEGDAEIKSVLPVAPCWMDLVCEVVR